MGGTLKQVLDSQTGDLPIHFYIDFSVIIKTIFSNDVFQNYEFDNLP